MSSVQGRIEEVTGYCELSLVTAGLDDGGKLGRDSGIDTSDNGLLLLPAREMKLVISQMNKDAQGVCTGLQKCWG